ncbi:peptidase S8/S53 domain-containing protein [Cercophora newfieldiana]|uniref:tripeptidyl-peptidase II n=1 Tax=Cercophora newfieldiana TaxID=92897 RepID=A0AA40D170_9PEZI|nr:peptidase S8/S53 domain-containing protein [Cercophora newfieldiana]
MYQPTRLQFLVFLVAFASTAANAWVDSYPVAYLPVPSTTPGSRQIQKSKRLFHEDVVQLDFSVATPENNVDLATRTLDELSDPESSRFGKHLSGREVARLFLPSKDSVAEVVQWLTGSGISPRDMRLSRNRGHLLVETSIAKASAILDTDIFAVNDREAHATIGTATYHLPRAIARHIDYVSFSLPSSRSSSYQPVVHPSPRQQGGAAQQQPPAAAATQVDCLRYMTPECLRALYNMSRAASDSAPHPNSSLGIFSMSWSAWLPNDLDAFFGLFEPALVGQRPKTLPINGGYTQTEHQSVVWNLECNLDHEYAMSLVHPIPSTNIQVGSRTQIGNTNMMVAAFSDDGYCEAGGIDPAVDLPVLDPENHSNYTDCGTVPDPPLVIAITYAWNEADFPARYLRRQCLEFLKLSLRGVTVLAATGDFGAADQRGRCVNATTGKPGNGNSTSHGLFSTSFPASCPFVTAVGATQLATTTTNATYYYSNATVFKFPPEIPLHTPNASSAGGFSRVFSRPPYQRAAVSSYLSHPDRAAHLSNLSSLGYFDRRGRAYPDLSANGVDYLVHSNGKLRAVSGASASTPVLAAMVARVNDGRLKAGKGPVGFLNGVLYRRWKEFGRGVLGGSGNRGCGVDEAFPVSEDGGWDAVTGLGTVDFGRLEGVLGGLP